MNSSERHYGAVARYGLLLVATAMIVSGCGKADSRSLTLEPTTAKQALEKSLTAWKSGQTPDSLKTSDPSIVVGDWAWSDGYKLASYRVLEERSQGPNLYCTVELVVTTPRSRSAKQKATYTVSTSPQLTVIRDDV